MLADTNNLNYHFCIKRKRIWTYIMHNLTDFIEKSKNENLHHFYRNVGLSIKFNLATTCD